MGEERLRTTREGEIVLIHVARALAASAPDIGQSPAMAGSSRGIIGACTLIEVRPSPAPSIDEADLENGTGAGSELTGTVT